MALSCFRSPVRSLSMTAALVALSFAAEAQVRGQALLGVYYGNQGWDMGQVRAMEAWQGKPHATVLLFTDWCSRGKSLDNLFKQQLPNIWANGNVPVVTWEPYLCSSGATPNDVVARAAKGEYDTYVGAWADRMKAFLSGPDGRWGTADDRRVYIRLAHEMNGNWYPWSAALGGSTPADYKQMWQRVRKAFSDRSMDSTTVQWIWSVNHEDVGGFGAESYYPGDGQVDWIGIDAYNWGSSQSWSSWRTPDEIFTPMLQRLRKVTAKPLALTETASSTAMSGHVDVAAKSLWITQLFRYAADYATDARMIVWFNEDKETDWAVFGGTNGDDSFKSGRTTYKAYRSYDQAVRGSALIPAGTGPRLMTDTTFAGTW